jgi:hypothetical protein
MIKTSYDPEADATFIWFGPEDAKSAEVREVAPGVTHDQPAKGSLNALIKCGPSEFPWAMVPVSARMTDNGATI